MNLIKKLKTIFVYLPLLWKDEDWDYAYLIYLIQFKLRRMAKTIENGHTESGPNDAKRMRIVCNHFDRYFDPARHDIYFTNVPEKNKSKWAVDLYEENPKFVFCEAQRKNFKQLDEWHWNSGWEIIRKHGRGWWD